VVLAFVSHPACRVGRVSSDNPSGAVNQQERPDVEQWAVGFVDGEGCFSISVVRNRVCRLGWQVQHEFSVTQLSPSRPALELLFEVFGCGTIIENRRHDDHREHLLRFSVKRRSDLVGRVVPFFEERPLRTEKQRDFERFVFVLRLMQDGAHLMEHGLRQIAAITQQMNRKQRSRYLESSEAIRQPPRSDNEAKRWSEPHGDMGGNSSEIPCRVSSDLHEWRNDLATVSTRDPAKLHDE
jgi:LAGLIDADG endonuclease